MACRFLAPRPRPPARRGWLRSLFTEPAIGSAARRALPADARSLTSCVCHGVAASVICASIVRDANTLALVGEATRAGTGCGSCRPEIAALPAKTLVPEPA